eukprot:7184433-Lingulodinium_polyedra.AAC.1
MNNAETAENCWAWLHTCLHTGLSTAAMLRDTANMLPILRATCTVTLRSNFAEAACMQDPG